MKATREEVAAFLAENTVDAATAAAMCGLRYRTGLSYHVGRSIQPAWRFGAADVYARADVEALAERLQARRDR